MPIVFRPDNQAFHDIDAAALTTANRLAAPGAIPKDALEAYKLEYEKCAQRYDDIYKAAWTNFSYMAIVAGAILTFGGDRFLPELSALLACFPLLSWWLASFEPLNKYGDKVINRLGWIELILTDIYELDNLTTAQRTELAAHKGLRHFREFKEREVESRRILWWKVFRWMIAMVVFAGALAATLKVLEIWQHGLLIRIIIGALIFVMLVYLLVDLYGCKRSWWEILPQFLRVRFVVRFFAFLLLIVAICLGFRVYQLHVNENKPLLMKKETAVKVIPVDFNKNVGVQLDGITAEQAKELLEKAEQQRATSPTTK